ncbi:hypothetical protein FZEAL_5219 [Fusarium zealandicum]|uniref:rRNA-processing protein EFG1 n=1 Tax=Fusarium zealandicum TaxID=1053134 RepID=A0A8H4XKU3_9HYPO|nr:hypothetical protein FZEAL_5219 [Fusarium zealandicum]
MGQKRDFAEVGSPEPDQGSRAFNGSEYTKKRKHNTKTKHRPNEGTSEWSKKRTRTIERLLKRNKDLPANVQNDLERELIALKSTVSDKAFQRKRSAMISKYHMVRFFERKKASRLAKQLRKKIDETESSEEIDELKRDLHVAEVDEAYTQHFPHAEAYISLYTNSKTEKEDAEDEKDDYKPLKHRGLLHTERPPMWAEVEQAMTEGPHALRGLRERRSADHSQGGNQTERRQKRPKEPTNAGKPAPRTQPGQQPGQQAAKDKNMQHGKGEAGLKMNRRERRRQMRQGIQQPAVKNDDDDSDGGGFFEE